MLSVPRWLLLRLTTSWPTVNWRYRELMERNVISRSQFDSFESRFDASVAQLRQARANLNVARNQADYASLKAPRDGVIAQRLAEAGQVVAAGQAVFVLAVDGDREVRIDLPEQDVGHFKIGMPVGIELWSRPGQVFEGKIRELSPAADPRSRTFEARVAFENTSVGADLGQSARVFVSGAANADILSIPLSALTAEGDATYVWVVKPDTLTLQKTPVEVGPIRNRWCRCCELAGAGLGCQCGYTSTARRADGHSGGSPEPSAGPEANATGGAIRGHQRYRAQ